MSEFKFDFTANLLPLLSVTVTKKRKSYRGCLNLLTHSNPRVNLKRRTLEVVYFVLIVVGE